MVGAQRGRSHCGFRDSRTFCNSFVARGSIEKSRLMAAALPALKIRPCKSTPMKAAPVTCGSVTGNSETTCSHSAKFFLRIELSAQNARRQFRCMTINRIELITDILNNAVDHSLRALIEKRTSVLDGSGESQVESQRHCDEGHAGNTEYEHPSDGYPKSRHGIFFRIVSFSVQCQER